MSGLTRIILRLGRNPEAGAPEGDDHHGYVIFAPLDTDGRLDAAMWAAHKRDCTVRRFRPGEAPSDGWLRHRGDHWFFWYDEADEGPAEDVENLAAHRLAPGEYVTIREGGGAPLTFRVAEAQAV
ncbi:MAG: hypothetical protein KJS97_12860 [Alphaproteobacteria bacterium]|nr:hypothetical protein [Alphaproteobacteria bacterium]